MQTTCLTYAMHMRGAHIIYTHAHNAYGAH